MDSFVYLVTLAVFFSPQNFSNSLQFSDLYAAFSWAFHTHAIPEISSFLTTMKTSETRIFNHNFLFLSFTCWVSSIFLKLQSPHQWRASFSSSPAGSRFTFSHLFIGFYLTASLILLTDEGLYSSLPVSVILTSHSL